MIMWIDSSATAISLMYPFKTEAVVRVENINRLPVQVFAWQQVLLPAHIVASMRIYDYTLDDPPPIS